MTKNDKVTFELKEAKEYYNYLHTLTDVGLMNEWSKVTNELKEKFGIIKSKSKSYERKSSSATMFT